MKEKVQSFLQHKGGKVLLKFELREYPEGIPGPKGEQFGVAPPHWTMKDPNGVITCWGHVGNGSFASVVALMKLAAVGAKRATQEELIEMGVIIKPKLEVANVPHQQQIAPRIWTPDDGGDDSLATHIGETGGFYDGQRQES